LAGVETQVPFIWGVMIMNSYNTSIFADVLALTEEVNQISSIQEIQQLVLSKLKNFGVEYIFAGIIPLKCHVWQFT
jgi:dUTPase